MRTRGAHVEIEAFQKLSLQLLFTITLVQMNLYKQTTLQNVLECVCDNRYKTLIL